MGLGNGNQAVISTCLGEITDRSNQSKAFTYLPVIYGIGGITGPLLGGLLAGRGGTEMTKTYPYLVPNMLSAGILLVDAVITMLYLEESLEDVQGLPPLGRRFQNLFPQFWQFLGGSTRPTYTRPGSGDDDESEIDEDEATEGGDSTTEPDTTHLHAKDVLNRDTILILATFFIFQLSNISYNSLYPVFAQASAPTGRDLNPEEIGISLGFAGAITILFQVGVFGRLRDKIGNRTTYRIGLGLFVLAYFLMPFVAYKVDEPGEPGLGVGKGALWTELGIVLIIKTVATVGSLTSALLLVSGVSLKSLLLLLTMLQITNSAPNHSVLGTLNGLAQTLSAAGRAIGPFIAGALFSYSTHVKPKGEALAFGIFGGIALVGFLLSFGIRGTGLEGGDWDEGEGGSEGDEEDDEDDDDDDVTDDGAQETTPLKKK